MSFSIVEGSVETRDAVIKASASPTVVSSSTTEVSFLGAAYLIGVRVHAQTQAVPYTVKIFSEASKPWVSQVISVESADAADVDLCKLLIPFVSSTSKAYVELSHSHGSPVTFDVVLYGQSYKRL